MSQARELLRSVRNLTILRDLAKTGGSGLQHRTSR